MYTVTVCLISGYILLPLLGANLLLLAAPLLPAAAQVFTQQGLTLVTWLVIFALLRFRYGPLREWLGLVRRRPLRYYAWETLKLLITVSALTLLLNQFWLLLERQWPGSPLPLEENPYAHYDRPELLMLSAFAVLTAPLLEEVIFRGLVQTTFQKTVSPIRAVVLTCLVFLLFHGSYFDNPRALSHVLVLGLCLGLWRARTQSLWPGIAVHLCNNILASLILLMH
jgi:membrane protease YdiL (CAAX protease family)